MNVKALGNKFLKHQIEYSLFLCESEIHKKVELRNVTRTLSIGLYFIEAYISMQPP